MKKIIKYVGFYNVSHATHPRVSSLAATDKMDYVCDVLNRTGYEVVIISPSWCKEPTAPFQKSITTELGDNKIMVSAPSFGAANKISRFMRIVLALCWLFWYLVRHVKHNEKILTYHTPWISVPIRLSKWIKKFQLILEVEEIYKDAAPIQAVLKRWEHLLLLSADSYIFSTEMLAEKVANGKPFCILYGRYQVVDTMATPPDDGKVHLLYAGVIDSHKKGAFNALESTQFLPEKYVLHIIGFGEVDKLKERINELRATNRCQVVYDGERRGDNYTRYVQSCHIGLSTQVMDGKYLQSSFPSKILSYLSMGLRVVSCHVECVSKSQVGDLVSYYYVDTPEAIANAIRSIDIALKYDAGLVLNQLEQAFTNKVNKLIG